MSRNPDIEQHNFAEHIKTSIAGLEKAVLGNVFKKITEINGLLESFQDKTSKLYYDLCSKFVGKTLEVFLYSLSGELFDENYEIYEQRLKDSILMLESYYSSFPNEKHNINITTAINSLKIKIKSIECKRIRTAHNTRQQQGNQGREQRGESNSYYNTRRRTGDALNEYEILGISYSSNWKEIRTAYLTLVKKYHPDNLDTGDRNKFDDVQNAYEKIKKARGE